jgi:hypothetical protein
MFVLWVCVMCLCEMNQFFHRAVVVLYIHIWCRRGAVKCWIRCFVPLLKSSLYTANFIVSCRISLSHVGLHYLKSNFVVSISLSRVGFHCPILNFIVPRRTSLSHVESPCSLNGQISYVREPGFFASIIRLTKYLQDFQQTPITSMR